MTITKEKIQNNIQFLTSQLGGLNTPILFDKYTREAHLSIYQDIKQYIKNNLHTLNVSKKLFATTTITQAIAWGLKFGVLDNKAGQEALDEAVYLIITNKNFDWKNRDHLEYYHIISIREHLSEKTQNALNDLLFSNQNTFFQIASTVKDIAEYGGVITLDGISCYISHGAAGLIVTSVTTIIDKTFVYPLLNVHLFSNIAGGWCVAETITSHPLTFPQLDQLLRGINQQRQGMGQITTPNRAEMMQEMRTRREIENALHEYGRQANTKLITKTAITAIVTLLLCTGELTYTSKNT